MPRICWQTQDEKKLRENKGGQSSKLVNATHSAQQPAHWKCGLIAQFSLQFLTFISSLKVSTAGTILTIRSSTFLNSGTLTFCWFFMIPWKFREVDMRLILWTNLDQLQHFIPVNSQQHPINCIRRCILPPFDRVFQELIHSVFQIKNWRSKC